MAAKPLKIDSLDLDLGNPRIVRTTDQRDAMQKILKEQGAKLVNLAESIAANGLNPMDRFLVGRSDKAAKSIVLEGNRRVLAIKLLKSAPLVNDLEMSDAFRKRLIVAGATFKPANVDPLDCFEVADRAEGSLVGFQPDRLLSMGRLTRGRLQRKVRTIPGRWL
jgi:hypothetical protein